MKVDFNTVIKKIDGEVLKEDVLDGEGKPKKNEDGSFAQKDLTLKKFVVDALLQIEKDKNGNPLEVSGEEKLTRYELAKRINQDKCEEITQDERLLIKKLCAKPFTTLVVGQIYEILDT